MFYVLSIGGVEGIGEAAVPGLTTAALHHQIDWMGVDELATAITEMKRALGALSAAFHMFIADFDRRGGSPSGSMC